MMGTLKESDTKTGRFRPPKRTKSCTNELVSKKLSPSFSLLPSLLAAPLREFGTLLRLQRPPPVRQNEGKTAVNAVTWTGHVRLTLAQG
jgi:hypothetical protein